MIDKDLNDIIIKSTKDVLEKMTFIDVELKESFVSDNPIKKKECGSYIKFSGKINGIMLLNFSKQFIIQATSSMLGFEDEDIGDDQIEDTGKEIANMIIGNVLSSLDKEKSIANLGIPLYYKDEKPDIFCISEKTKVFIFSYSSMEFEEGEDYIIVELITK